MKRDRERGVNSVVLAKREDNGKKTITLHQRKMDGHPIKKEVTTRYCRSTEMMVEVDDTAGDLRVCNIGVST